MTIPDPKPELTQRQEFLAAADEIRAVYQDTSVQISFHGRQRIQDAYRALYVLGSHVPDVPAGSPLPYGGMDDKDIARSLRHAENGMASPAVTLQLIAELRRLRMELDAIGGPSGVTDDDIRSQLGEGFHTAFRKAVDDPQAIVIHTLIDKLRDDTDCHGRSSWSAVISFVANPLIAMLRRAEAETLARAEQPGPGGDSADEVRDRHRNVHPGYVAGARPHPDYGHLYQGTLALPGERPSWLCCHTHSADDAISCARTSAAEMGWALHDSNQGTGNNDKEQESS